MQELASTDWQKEIFRTALSQNYSQNFGGGNDVRVAKEVILISKIVIEGLG